MLYDVWYQKLKNILKKETKNEKKFGNIVSMLVYKKLLQMYLVCFREEENIVRKRKYLTDKWNAQKKMSTKVLVPSVGFTVV
jgi:hypothetical protein